MPGAGRQSVKRSTVGRVGGIGVYTFPMKHSLLGLCVAMLVSFAPAAPAAVRALPEDAVLVAPSALAAAEPAARALEQQVVALLADRPADAIALLAAEADPLVFERAADRLIERLRAQPPSTAGGALLDWLATRPARVFQRHDETAADWFVPLFDPASRARGTQAIWQHATERAHWQQRLAQDPGAALAELGEAEPASVWRAAEAIAGLTAGQHAALRKALDGASPVALWLASARRQPDPLAYAAVLRRGDEAQQLELVAAAATALPPEAALRFLETASRQATLASASIVALAALAPRHPPALQRIEAWLADPQQGASAAAALARMPSSDRVQRIEALLDDADATKATHLALALRLEGSADAQAVLRRWAEDPRLPERLRRELQR